MPRLTASASIEGVRRNDKYRAIPILVLTTESDAEKKNRGTPGRCHRLDRQAFDPAKLIDALSA